MQSMNNFWKYKPIYHLRYTYDINPFINEDIVRMAL